MKVTRTKGAGYDRLQAMVSEKQDYVGKVGWLESAKYEDGTPIAYVAAIQEFGSPKNNIPSRSFMRTTIAEQGARWMQLAKSGAKAVVAGNETVRSVVEKIGFQAQGDIGDKISSITSPALARATLSSRKRRGNSSVKPLVDTKMMLRTLTSVVEDKP